MDDVGGSVGGFELRRGPETIVGVPPFLPAEPALPKFDSFFHTYPLDPAPR